MLPEVIFVPLLAWGKLSVQLTAEGREAVQVRCRALAEQAGTLGAQPDC